MKDLIQKLVETVAPSGYEDAVRDVVRKEIEAFADDIKVDALGNMIVRKGRKKPDGMRIMLAAHMDEIGVIATHIDENGFVRFTNLGGVRANNCMGGRVRFVNGAEGVIYSEQLEPGKPLSLEKMYIDVGATSREDCNVQVGEVAAFQRPFLDLGDRLVAKALDDRIGVAVLIDALRGLKKSSHELYFVFTVQEEVGCRGAVTSAFGVEPDIGIAVDVTLTGDTPKGIKMATALGKGPAIKIQDSGMISDRRIVQLMIDAAEKKDIAYQLEVLQGGATDAYKIQTSRAGVPSGCVSIPCRYVHSPSEMVDYNDVKDAVSLLVEILQEPIKL